MADYYTQFSCILNVGTAEKAARADMIRGEFAAELDRHEGEALGFDMEVDHESGPGALWIHSDEYGNRSTSSASHCGARASWGWWDAGASPGAVPVRGLASMRSVAPLMCSI